MLVNLSGDIWEIIPIDSKSNKAILRGKSDEGLTIPMNGFEEWEYNYLEDLQNCNNKQKRIIFVMQKWGQSKYEIERESKIIFS